MSGLVYAVSLCHERVPWARIWGLCLASRLGGEDAENNEGMKIAVIGVGNVGKALIQDFLALRFITEIVLVGRNQAKLEAEVTDMMDAAVLREGHAPRFTCGGYEATAGADIIVYTAGATNLVDDRMVLAEENVKIATSVFSEVAKHNREAIVICIANPLDLVATAIAKVSGRPESKIIGTGTLLESARLSRMIADLVEVSPKSVDAIVIGEHGNSCVPVLSAFRIMGQTLEEYLSQDLGTGVSLSVEHIQHAVMGKGFRIYRGKGYTNYGVSASACRLIAAIATDAREILPVSTFLQGQYGVDGFFLSVPCIIGKDGVEAVVNLPLTDSEAEAFAASAGVVRSALQNVGLLS